MFDVTLSDRKWTAELIDCLVIMSVEEVKPWTTTDCILVTLNVNYNDDDYFLIIFIIN